MIEIRPLICAMVALGTLACSEGGPASAPPTALVPSPTPGYPPPSPVEYYPSPGPTPTPAKVWLQFFGGSDYGDVIVTSAFGATCNLAVTMPDGTAIPGFQPMLAAPPDGRVEWSNFPPEMAAPGEGTIAATCSLGGESATASFHFRLGD